MRVSVVQMSERARARARELLAHAQLPSTAGLRLAVEGGGCSGLSYAVHLDRQPAARDRVFEFDGVRVFVDPRSLVYLAGTLLDYKNDLPQPGFVFENPNAAEGCGCSPATPAGN